MGRHWHGTGLIWVNTDKTLLIPNAPIRPRLYSDNPLCASWTRRRYIRLHALKLIYFCDKIYLQRRYEWDSERGLPSTQPLPSRLIRYGRCLYYKINVMGDGGENWITERSRFSKPTAIFFEPDTSGRIRTRMDTGQVFQYLRNGSYTFGILVMGRPVLISARTWIH